ncbi:Atp-binding cassette superfamily, partial [Globisporangium polare]
MPARKDEPSDTAYVRVQTPRASAAANKTPAPLDEKAGSKPNPIDSASWLSRVTLWWVNPLIRKGYASPLLEDDVWQLPKIDTSVVLQESFDRYYQQEKHKRAGKKKKDDYTPILKPLWNATKG